MADITDSPSTLCQLCHNTAIYRCMSCRCSLYCSEDCQKKDWSIHKLLCRTYKDFDVTDRPSDRHVRAIYFPPDESRPRFIWLEVSERSIDDGNESTWEPINLPYRFDPEAYAQRTQLIVYNPVLQRSTHTWIGFRMCTKIGPLSDFAPSDSWQKVNEELGELLRPPMVFYGCGRNLDTVSFRHVVDFMRRTYDEMHRIMDCAGVGAPLVDGVILNCTGDVAVFQYPIFAQAKFPTSLCELDSESLIKLSIGDEIGIPLIAGALPVGLSWKNRTINGIPAENNDTMRTIDTASREVRRGSVAIARKDGKLLLAAHMKSLTAYCRDLARNVPFDQVEEEDLLGDGHAGFQAFHEVKERIPRKSASKKGFQNFYRGWIEDSDEAEYQHLPGPYDV